MRDTGRRDHVVATHRVPPLRTARVFFYVRTPLYMPDANVSNPWIRSSP